MTWRYGDCGYSVAGDPFGREFGPMTWPLTFGEDMPREGCER